MERSVEEVGPGLNMRVSEKRRYRSTVIGNQITCALIAEIFFSEETDDRDLERSIYVSVLAKYGVDEFRVPNKIERAHEYLQNLPFVEDVLFRRIPGRNAYLRYGDTGSWNGTDALQHNTTEEGTTSMGGHILNLGASVEGSHVGVGYGALRKYSHEDTGRTDYGAYSHSQSFRDIAGPARNPVITITSTDFTAANIFVESYVTELDRIDNDPSMNAVKRAAGILALADRAVAVGPGTRTSVTDIYATLLLWIEDDDGPAIIGHEILAVGMAVTKLLNAVKLIKRNASVDLIVDAHLEELGLRYFEVSSDLSPLQVSIDSSLEVGDVVLGADNEVVTIDNVVSSEDVYDHRHLGWIKAKIDLSIHDTGKALMSTTKIAVKRYGKKKQVQEVKKLLGENLEPLRLSNKEKLDPSESS